jgi:hypothetical protein
VQKNAATVVKVHHLLHLWFRRITQTQARHAAERQVEDPRFTRVAGVGLHVSRGAEFPRSLAVLPERSHALPVGKAEDVHLGGGSIEYHQPITDYGQLSRLIEVITGRDHCSFQPAGAFIG